jgi:hypothetical protein
MGFKKTRTHIKAKPPLRLLFPPLRSSIAITIAGEWGTAFPSFLPWIKTLNRSNTLRIKTGAAGALF